MRYYLKTAAEATFIKNTWYRKKGGKLFAYMCAADTTRLYKNLEFTLREFEMSMSRFAFPFLIYIYHNHLCAIVFATTYQQR